MRNRTLLTLLAAFAMLLTSFGVAVAGTVSNNAGFEGADGNLAPQAPINFDWNSFATVTWGGTAPYRTSAKTVAPWEFTGLEDAQEDGDDTAFAGGTKQDDNCATVKFGPKPPNKDDLKRIYIAHATKEVSGQNHVFLGLAWVRITQNTTNASAHVGFEFNQNEGGCPNSTIPGNDGLSSRSTANGGDMLIVYDFEGSSTDSPNLKLLRWRSSGACEAGGTATATTPCWVFGSNLTTSGVAEGKVNTSDVGSVADQLAPPNPPATASVSQTLGNNEFGEAIVDLTAAGVFPATPTSCLNFGRAFGVSRSSGNSQQAAMKDLVGPGDISISNCAQVIIRKETVPDPDPVTEFGYTTDVATLPATTTSPFSLKDGEANTINNVSAPGSYFVTEDDPSGDDYLLIGIDCSASTVPGANINIDVSARTVDFDLGPDEVLDCTFTNERQTGALKILKNSTKGGAVSTAGAVFSFDGASVTDNGAGDEDPAVGVVCVSGLAPGDYTVNETSPPPGYGGATETDLVATVVTGTDCGASQPTGTAVVTFTNSPLSDIQVRFRDAGSGETSAVIACDNTTGTSSTADTADWDDTLTVSDVEAPTTITCTIVIDP